jgi:hypothetical protein
VVLRLRIVCHLRPGRPGTGEELSESRRAPANTVVHSLQATMVGMMVENCSKSPCSAIGRLEDGSEEERRVAWAASWWGIVLVVTVRAAVTVVAMMG